MRRIVYITTARARVLPRRDVRLLVSTFMGSSFSTNSNSTNSTNYSTNRSNTSNMSADAPAPPTVQKSESEWQAILSPGNQRPPHYFNKPNEQSQTADVKPTEQFRIIRQKGTEAPHSGAYESHASSGTYACAACSTPLYKSTTKFDSGCGWPAFYEGLPGAINRSEDRSLGSVRTEITCAACGGHLGHVFKGEGFGTPTDERHCVNSVSLKFADE